MVFCGRILMFLAHFFPLSERSGGILVSYFYCDNFEPPAAVLNLVSQSFCKAVNIKGIFNTSNETKYEKEPPGDGMAVFQSLIAIFLNNDF